MTEDLFGERRRALEEEFFRKQNAKLLAAMRAASEAEHVKAALRDTAGITDEHLLEHFVSAGMTPATLSAVALVPLVAVAWADRHLEEGERDQVLREARTMDLGESARALLASWLAEQPEASLFETWVEYIRDLLPRLDPAARDKLRETTCARSAVVAEAAGGGPYKMGRRTSGEEKSVLARIEAAFAG